METVKISTKMTSAAQLKSLFEKFGAGLGNSLPQLYRAIEGGRFTANVTATETNDGAGIYLAVENPISGSKVLAKSGIYYDGIAQEQSIVEVGKSYKATLTFKELIPGITPELVETAYGSTNPAAVRNFKLAHAKKDFTYVEVLELEY